MNPDLWTYRDDLDDLDLAGFDVEATDGEIGAVEEATVEAGRSFIVVDTGRWLTGRRSVLPAGCVVGVDYDQERVYVDRTKDEIKNAPEFDADDWGFDGSSSRARFESYYGS